MFLQNFADNKWILAFPKWDPSNHMHVSTVYSTVHFCISSLSLFPPSPPTHPATLRLNHVRCPRMAKGLVPNQTSGFEVFPQHLLSGVRKIYFLLKKVWIYLWLVNS